MSISIGTDGRVVTGRTNVIIPPENAGIGDLIYGTRSDFQVIGRGTASGTTVNGRPLYGCIYGFVNGHSMVCAELGNQSAWGNSSIDVSSLLKFDINSLMRNGRKNSRVAMNLSRLDAAGAVTSNGASQPSDGILSSAYASTPLTAATFSSSANAATKSKFVSWEEYIGQTLRVNGAPNTLFGATTTGVKVYEFGRWMTSQIGTNSNFTAAYYCWTTFSTQRDGVAGMWWLPSMYEIGEIMIDDHFNRLTENPQVSIANNQRLWSCLVRNSERAWYYEASGYSDNYIFSFNSPRIVPVTLFKLT